jgi:hypothetical protein
MQDKKLMEHFEKTGDRLVEAIATLRILGEHEALSKEMQLLAQDAYVALLAALGYLGEIRDGVVVLEARLGLANEQEQEQEKHGRAGEILR